MILHILWRLTSASQQSLSQWVENIFEEKYLILFLHLIAQKRLLSYSYYIKDMIVTDWRNTLWIHRYMNVFLCFLLAYFMVAWKLKQPLNTCFQEIFGQIKLNRIAKRVPKAWVLYLFTIIWQKFLRNKHLRGESRLQLNKEWSFKNNFTPIVRRVGL